MIKPLLLGLFMMATSACVAQNKKIDFKRKSTNLAEGKKPDVMPTSPGSKMPDFEIINAKKDLVFKSDLVKAGKPFVVMFFNPSCGHCQDASRMIADSLAEYRDIPFILITGENMVNELKTFADATGLSSIPNVTVAADHSMVSTQLFESKGIPQIMFYNKEQVLQKTIYINFHREDVVKELDKLK